MAINLNHEYCSCGAVVTVAVVDNAQDCCKSKFLNYLQKGRDWRNFGIHFPNMCYERLLATMHAVLQYPEIVVYTHEKIEITLKLITKR